MSYQPLARKYRPQKFDDLVGQQSVVLSLSNAIRLGRIIPCLIFAGVRGIGKTTVARLYAKALNCENGPTHEPCNNCESCLAIASGIHEDVIEIDGASNNGVDDVRLLQETLGYVPQRSKFKIYIIDEVHMLTANAFNALLKTLEEPPSHVVFIFATTELRQIPDTILGRCQVYHLRKLSVDQISSRLRDILVVEGIEFDQAALDIVAKEGQGSMRDAITFLDQLIALGGGKLEYKKICEMIAYVPSSMCLEFVRHLMELNVSAVLELVTQWDQKGVAFTLTLDEIIRNIRDICVVKEMGQKAAQAISVGVAAQSLELLEQIAAKSNAHELHTMFKAIAECRSQLSGSSMDRYIVDNCVMEWTLAKRGERRQTEVSVKPHGEAPAPVGVVTDVSSSLVSGKPLVEKSSPPSGAAVNGGIGPLHGGGGEIQAEVGEVKRPGKDNSALIAEESDKAAQEATFPESWKLLVERWKRKKPLKARIIEEAHLVEYSPAKIVLAVDPLSLAGREFLRSDAQKDIAEQFRLQFGFNGVLSVSSCESLAHRNCAPSVGGDADTSQNTHDETLLETRKKEKDLFKQKVIDSVTQHQVTQKALCYTSGEIESIEIKQDECLGMP